MSHAITHDIFTHFCNIIIIRHDIRRKGQKHKLKSNHGSRLTSHSWGSLSVEIRHGMHHYIGSPLNGCNDDGNQ